MTLFNFPYIYIDNFSLFLFNNILTVFDIYDEINSNSDHQLPQIGFRIPHCLTRSLYIFYHLAFETNQNLFFLFKTLFFNLFYASYLF